MEALLIIVIIVIVVNLIQKGRKMCEDEETSLKVNSVYICRNNRREKIATFSEGNVFMIGFQGKEIRVGHYDKDGKVYNIDDCMIGFVKGDRMIISKEFPPVYQKSFCLGEVLGNTRGTVFESDINGRYQYDNGSAFYETVEENPIGVGAAYMLLVYEGVIESPHEKRFKV